MLYFLLLLAVLLLPLKVRFKANTVGKAIEIQTEFVLLFTKFKLKKMSITANKVIRRILSRKKQKTNKARILTGVVKNTRIDVLDIQVEIGLESAVSTAVVCGQTLAVLLTLAKNFTPNARAEVKPCFDEKKLSLRGKAEISFNIANVIAIAIYCLPKHSKGERKWKNILSKT